MAQHIGSGRRNHSLLKADAGTLLRSKLFSKIALTCDDNFPSSIYDWTVPACHFSPYRGSFC
jgi:hypothetical protein